MLCYLAALKWSNMAQGVLFWKEVVASVKRSKLFNYKKKEKKKKNYFVLYF